MNSTCHRARPIRPPMKARASVTGRRRNSEGPSDDECAPRSRWKPTCCRASRPRFSYLRGDSVVGAVLSGFFAACGAYAGILLGPLSLLVAGVGSGVRAFATVGCDNQVWVRGGHAGSSARVKFRLQHESQCRNPSQRRSSRMPMIGADRYPKSSSEAFGRRNRSAPRQRRSATEHSRTRRPCPEFARSGQATFARRWH